MTASFSIIGCNHLTSPLSVREHIAFHKDNITEALVSLNQVTGVEQGFILSTCNRTEIYYYGDAERSSIIIWLADFHHIATSSINNFIYQYEDKTAMIHLLKVASGLDSMALGETQVLGQIKDGYKIAQAQGCLSGPLDGIMQFIFATTKKVRSSTDIGKHTITLASTAVNIAIRMLGDLSENNALVVGAGENARLTAEYLHSRGIKKLYIANRTYAKAEQLAKKHKGEALALMDIASYLPRVNAIFTSTSGPTILIGKGMVEDAVKKWGRKPLFISDMSLPHDVEDSVAELDQVYLYTLKDLETVLTSNRALKEKEISKVELLIEKEINTYLSTMVSSNDILKEYRAQVDDWKQQELQKALNEVKDGDEKTQKTIRQLADRLAAKLSHGPTEMIKEGTNNNDIKSLLHIRNNLIKKDDT